LLNLIKKVKVLIMKNLNF